MKKKIIAIVIGLTFSSMYFGSVGAAGWFWKVTSVLEWDACLAQQQYGTLFKAINATRGSDVLAWLKQAETREKMDPFLFYMHARQCFKDQACSDHFESSISMVLCILLTKMAEEMLRSLRVVLLHDPGHGWTVYMAQKFLHHFTCMNKMNAVNFNDLRGRIMEILSNHDIVQKIVSPYWLREVSYPYVNYGSTYGITWPDVAQIVVGNDRLKEDSIAQEIKVLRALQNWDDFFAYAQRTWRRQDSSEEYNFPSQSEQNAQIHPPQADAQSDTLVSVDGVFPPQSVSSVDHLYQRLWDRSFGGLGLINIRPQKKGESFPEEPSQDPSSNADQID